MIKTELLKTIANCERGEAGRVSIPKEFDTDHEVSLAVLRKDNQFSQHFLKLKSDKEYAKKHLLIKPADIDLFDNNDKELCLIAARHEGFSINFMSTAMRKDRDVVLCAVKQNGLTYQYSSRAKDIRFDKEIISEALKQNGNALQDMPKVIKEDESYVKLAVASNGRSLRYADEFNNNFEIVKLALMNDGLALESVSQELRDNYDLVKLALNTKISAFVDASDRLKANKELALYSLRKKHENFAEYHVSHLDASLRSDREIAFHAIKYSPIAIKDMSYDLRDDYELADMAISINGAAYLHISNRLQLDKELLLKALENTNIKYLRNGYSGFYMAIPESLRNQLPESDLINSLKKLILNEKLNADLKMGESSDKKMKI